jgi:hypothetical protein
MNHRIKDCSFRLVFAPVISALTCAPKRIFFFSFEWIFQPVSTCCIRLDQEKFVQFGLKPVLQQLQKLLIRLEAICPFEPCALLSDQFSFAILSLATCLYFVFS